MTCPHIQMSHVPHLNQSLYKHSPWSSMCLHLWHVPTYKWVMSHVSRSTRHFPHVNFPRLYHHSLSWVCSPLWHVPTHMHDSCLTHDWVTSYVKMSRVSRRNESCPTYERVMAMYWSASAVSRISYVLPMKKSCPTYESVMSHISRVDKSCPTCKWVLFHVWTIYGNVLTATGWLRLVGSFRL